MVQFSREQALELVRSFMEKAVTWPEVKSMIVEHGFADMLTPEDNMQVLDWWHQKTATQMTDYQLFSDLEFWGNGGTYASHLDGFYAVRPDILVEEAKQRQWTIKEMPSSILINGPIGKPIILKKK